MIINIFTAIGIGAVGGLLALCLATLMALALAAYNRK